MNFACLSIVILGQCRSSRVVQLEATLSQRIIHITPLCWHFMTARVCRLLWEPATWTVFTLVFALSLAVMVASFCWLCCSHWDRNDNECRHKVIIHLLKNWCFSQLILQTSSFSVASYYLTVTRNVQVQKSQRRHKFFQLWVNDFDEICDLNRFVMKTFIFFTDCSENCKFDAKLLKSIESVYVRDCFKLKVHETLRVWSDGDVKEEEQFSLSKSRRRIFGMLWWVPKSFLWRLRNIQRRQL